MGSLRLECPRLRAAWARIARTIGMPHRPTLLRARSAADVNHSGGGLWFALHHRRMAAAGPAVVDNGERDTSPVASVSDTGVGGEPRPLRVLVVDEDPQRAAILEAGLLAADAEIAAVVAPSEALVLASSARSPCTSLKRAIATSSTGLTRLAASPSIT